MKLLVKKRIWATALSFSILLGIILTFAYRSEMNVNGNAGYEAYIQNVRNALTQLETNGTTTNVPYDSSKLTEGTKEYTISTSLDWMALMVLSYETSLEGYTFYTQNDSSGVYNLKEVTVGDAVFCFEGISLNPEHPFKGTLNSVLAGSGITLNLSAPLFGYLDAVAKINVNAEGGATDVVFSLNVDEGSAGLAQVLTGSGTVSDATIRNINLAGNVKNPGGAAQNPDGYAGGIFGEIKGPMPEINPDADPLVIESLGINSSIENISGLCVGGIAGKVSGKVQFQVNNSTWKDSVAVKCTPNSNVETTMPCAGILFGEVQGTDEVKPEIITMADDFTIGNSSVSGAAYTGGLIGKATNCALNLNGNIVVRGSTGALDISSKVTAPATNAFSGGIVGYMENATVALAEGKSLQIKTSGSGTYLGGFAGFMRGCVVTLPAVSVSSNYSGIVAGGFIGQSEGSTLTLGTLSILDEYVINGSLSHGGGFIGQDISSTYNITTVEYNSKSIKVECQTTACCLGGFAGCLTDTLLTVTNTISTSGNSIQNTSSTSDSERSIFVGGIIGKYVNTTEQDRLISNINIEKVKIFSQATTKDTFVGGIVGALETTGSGKFRVSDCVVKKIEGKGGSTMHLGGIVGGNFAPGTTISNITAQFTTSRTSLSIGGVLAYAGADCSISNAKEMLNTSNRGSAAYSGYHGGIVGIVASGKNVKIEDVAFSSDAYLSNVYGGGTYNGGIVSKVESGAVVALNGTIDLSNLKQTSGGNCSGYYASLVAYQDNALVYVNPVSYSVEQGYQYGLIIPAERFEDEVGNYGAVYRNGNLDSDSPATDLSDRSEWLISEDAGGKTVIKADNDPYTLATPGDCARLSIALNTEDKFTGFGEVSWTTLLSGNYTLSNNIDLSNTGILTLNKNKTDSKYYFKGSIASSEGQKYRISNILTAAHQGNLGLFSGVGSGASFKDMEVSISLKYSYYESDNMHTVGTNTGTDTSIAYKMLGQQNYGTIAAYAEGGVTVDNVSILSSLKEDRCLVMESAHLKNRYFGGVFGQYVAKADKQLMISNLVVNTNMTVSEAKHFAGGVIGYVNTDTSGGTLSLTDVTVEGTIKSIYDNSLTKDNDGKDSAPVGGVIALVGKEAAEDADSVSEKVKILLDTIYINGLQIQDDLAESKERTFECGGLLGYKWRNVDVSATGITVSTYGTDIAPGIVVSDHATGSVYGGLWNTVWGHASLKDVAINSMNISVPGTAQGKPNGLLVGRGQYLYLELENYTIDAGKVTISDNSAQYFDEIVGFNRGKTAENKEEDCGGVVSINTAVTYDLYENKVVSQANPYSRYYYNLAKDLADVTTLGLNTAQIDTVGELLQWSLAHYVNQPLRSFFRVAEGYDTSGENITFSGTIDLVDASYYPVSVVGGFYHGSADSKIIFHGKIFDDKVRTLKATNEDKSTFTYEKISEHYKLQSGLFYNVTQSQISGLTLSGSVTAIEEEGAMFSGALVAGSILGVELPTEDGSEYINYDATPTKITKIVLDAMAVSHVQADDWHGNYGLLVSRIGSGAKVHFGPEDATEETAGVSMINYNKQADKVAAALIGMVGSEAAQGMNLTFANMVIADVADAVSSDTAVGRSGITETDSKMNIDGAKVLAHASFIYNYQYRLDNTTGVYIFYLDDYKTQNVTLGSEIEDKVQFYDATLIQPIKDYTSGGANGCLAFDETNYKPYVYQTKKIDVNPKNGNILKGCGTYDSPYVIETSNQLMTLYYYLSDHDRYKNALLDWEINAFGTDTVTTDAAVVGGRIYTKKFYNIGLKKDANDNDISLESTYASLTLEGFPSIEQLNNAYYMITKDIDLTLENKFTGFGTEELPFTGVFIGRYLTEEGTEEPTKQCEILMPTSGDEGASRYGFIKYAKGAVIRNLHLNLGTDQAKVTYNGTGAGAMAVVLGGDNILDGVRVSGKLQTLSQYGVSYANAGGYVGDLQKGSVILRDYQADALSSFSISRQGSDGDGVGAYQKGIVGKVQDGFVVDDDTNVDISSVYAANPAKMYTAAVPGGFDLNATDTMNVEDLDNSCNLQGQIKDCIAALNKSDKISVAQTEAEGYQYNLDSAQDLLVVSFAINSGAMNYWGNKNIGTTTLVLTAGIYGYDKFSRCRTEDYSYVGNVISDSARQAYLNVIKYDNENPYTKDATSGFVCEGNTYGQSFYRPYIFNYFDFADGVEVLNGKTYDSVSCMNQVLDKSAGNEKYLSTYNLAAGTYDMSALSMKKCFKGIGAKTAYSFGNNPIFCSLKGNFKGAGSDFSGTNSGATTIKIDLDYTKYNEAALFQVLYSGSVNNLCSYEMSGFNLTGNVRNSQNKKDTNTMAAGIAPRVYGNYSFKNIVAENMTVDSTVTPDTATAINPASTTSAAFIARADYMGITQNNEINFESCKLSNVTVKAWDSCGGFIAVNETNGKGNTFTDCVVEDSTIYSNRGNVGGFLGSSNYETSFQKCKLNGTEVTREYIEAVSAVHTRTNDEGGIGGFAGFFGADEQKVAFNQCFINEEITTQEGKSIVSNVPYNAAYYSKHVGGFVGALTGEKCEVSFENCNIYMLDLEQHTPGNVGGFMGTNRAKILLNAADASKSEVRDVSIDRDFQYCCGGIIGKQDGAAWEEESVISNIDITGLDIVQGWESTSYIGGVVGQHYSGILNINKVHVLGTKEHPTRLKYKVQSTTDSDVKLYAGGIVGLSNSSGDNYTKLTLKDCSFKGEANSEGAHYAKIINSYYSGGVIGAYSNKNQLTIENCNVENAAIQAVNACSEKPSETPSGAGGGIAGQIDNGSKSEVKAAIIKNSTISNVDMKNYDESLSEADTETQKNNLASTKSKTIAYGGIVGCAKKTLDITDFSVDTLKIGEDGYAGEAGGVVGMLIGAKCTIDTSESGSNRIENSCVVAGVAGGIFGNTQRTGLNSAASSVSVSNVTVELTTVMSKYLASTGWDMYAGGVAGRHEVKDTNTTYPSSPDVHTYENVTVRNSVISAYRTDSTVSARLEKTFLGGFVGGQLECEVQSYSVSLENVLVGQLLFSSTMGTVVPDYASVTDGSVTLYLPKAAYSESTAAHTQETLTTESGKMHVSKEYALNTGMWTGIARNVKNTYIAEAKVGHDTALSHFHPASDVGVSPADMSTLMADASAGMSEVYDTYTENMHLLYQDTVPAMNPDVPNKTLIGEKLGVSDYYFGDMEAILTEKFGGQTVDENCDYRLDYNFMQKNTDGSEMYAVGDVLEASYKTENGYLSPYEWNNEKIPMLVSAGKYDINTVINTAINVLTNNGGATNGIWSVESKKTGSKLLNVSIRRIKYQPEQTENPFTDAADGKNVLSFDAETGEFSISDKDFDSIDDGTFNLVTVEYRHADGKVYSLNLPVFVRETVKITTHMKGIAGGSYKISDIPSSNTEPAEKRTQVNVELNSTYTLYTEFIYSSAREEYSEIKLKKSLYRTYQNGTNIQPFAVGTRITLMDVTNKDTVYYYEVTEDNQNTNGGRIYFEDFKTMDDAGTYINGDVSKTTLYPVIDEYQDICNRAETAHKDVGLEQFLIVIDESNTNATTSTIYDLYVRAEENDNVDLFKNAFYSSPCFVRVNEIPKLYKVLSGSEEYKTNQSKITLTGKTDTTIAENSKISRDATLDLSGTAYIVSPNTINASLPDYWGFASSSNKSQYLELAVSLQDSTGNRITVPNGTMVTVKLGGLDYGTVVATNSEYIYCYYDTQNGKPDPSHLDLNKCSGDLAVDFDVSFDFSSATDFSAIKDSEYKVKVELLDTPDREYPRNGDQCDTITIGPVPGINKRSLGFALEVDNMLTLGVNGYNSESSDKGRILFKSRLDFSDYLESSGDGFADLNKEFNNKYFTYTFVLEQKNTEGLYADFGYEPNKRYDSPVKILTGQTIEEWKDIPGLEDLDTKKKVIVSKTVQYTADTDKTADGEAVQNEISLANPIMEEQFTAFANVEELLKTPANITNYKVNCYVTVSDTEPDVNDTTALREASLTNDFFIFTVAKLKTDMD